MAAPLRVLIAEDGRAQLLIMKRMLTKEGIVVVEAEDGVTAQKALTTEKFDAAVLDWMLPGIDGIEVARKLAANDGAPRPRLIVTSVIDMPMAREHALAAGADEFLPKPFTAKDFIECVRATGPAKGRTLGDVGAAHPVARARAWKDLPTSMGEALTELMQAQAVGDDAPALPKDPMTRHVTCSLVDATRGCEVWMAFVAQDPDARALASKMLEDPDPSNDDTQGVLAELANVVIGAVKTAFHEEGFGFTIGLPGSSTAEDLNLAFTGAVATKTIRLRIAEATVFAGVAIRAKGPADIPVESLQEGHVLAEDARTGNGALLLPAGTRLTASAVNRLRDVLEGKSVKVVS